LSLEVTVVTHDRRGQVPRLFDRISGLYDASVLQALVYRPPQDAILRELRKRSARRVADVGCGTGILAARIQAELGPETVYGCDLSAGMLEQACGRSDEVLWVLARSESLPIRSASLDAVVSSHAFHFFDQAAAVEEFRRVLEPAGIAAVAVVAPRTETGSRAVELGLGGAGRFPQQAELKGLFQAAGFRAVRQMRVRRGPFQLTSPDVVTVAVAP
jgi:ubiquinone/menaquinone biosynthesis C-methylase UbiE